MCQDKAHGGRRCPSSSGARANGLNAANKRLRRVDAHLANNDLPEDERKKYEEKKQQILVEKENLKKQPVEEEAPSNTNAFGYVTDVAHQALDAVYGDDSRNASIAKQVQEFVSKDPVFGTDKAVALINETYGSSDGEKVTRIVDGVVQGDYVEEGDLSSALDAVRKPSPVSSEEPAESDKKQPRVSRLYSDNEDSDSSGFDSNGFNKDTGLHRSGHEYDPETGLDVDGYDYNGFDAQGINRDTGTKYNDEGYDKNGYDKNGEKDPYFYVPTFGDSVDVDDLDVDIDEVDLEEDDDLLR